MRIFSSGLLFGVALFITAQTKGQEVRFVDLTTVEQRIALRSTPPPKQTHLGPDGSAGVAASSQSLMVGECGLGANEPRALQTTVTWLDRLSYKEGDSIEWEVKIENAGSVPISLAASPHLSDLQPRDASEPFSYDETGIGLAIRTEDGRADLAHVSVYGSHSEPGTMVTLEVGEWIRVRSRSRIEFSNMKTARTLSGEAVARFWLHHGKITPGPGTYGTSLMNECLRSSEGAGMPLRIDQKRSE
jgi:hypothetical protein